MSNTTPDRSIPTLGMGNRKPRLKDASGLLNKRAENVPAPQAEATPPVTPLAETPFYREEEIVAPVEVVEEVLVTPESTYVVAAQPANETPAPVIQQNPVGETRRAFAFEAPEASVAPAPIESRITFSLPADLHERARATHLATRAQLQEATFAAMMIDFIERGIEEREQQMNAGQPFTATAFEMTIQRRGGRPLGSTKR